MTISNKPENKNGETLVDLSLTLTEDPIKKLEQGKKAAAALMTVANPVTINGKQYLRFEDLQTIGAFFGTIVGTSDPEFVVINGTPGYKATAVVRRVSDGMIISTASAFCLREGAWKSRENFALASMAQTRAGVKCLRNVYAWISVLAGYQPTPAEEMIPTAETETADNNESLMASVKQLDYILGLAEKAYEKDAYQRLEDHFQIKYGKKGQELTKTEASETIEWLRNGEELLR